MAKRARPSTGVRDEVSDAFITASRALVGMAIRSLNAAPVEVTLPQHRVMVLLAGGGPQSVGELAEQLGVDPSNGSRLCDRLQRAGLVARERSLHDRRAVNVLLTDEGRQLLETVNEHRRREVRQVLARMSPLEVDTAVQGLQAFSRAAHELASDAWVVAPL